MFSRCFAVGAEEAWVTSEKKGKLEKKPLCLSLNYEYRVKQLGFSPDGGSCVSQV